MKGLQEVQQIVVEVSQAPLWQQLLLAAVAGIIGWAAPLIAKKIYKKISKK